ncbi:MAG: carboxy-S-adenosyl-L-methionine synthase CmoA [Pseudomonadota bacterium]
MMPDRDRYYAQPIGDVPDFSFNADVVRVFDDMIGRSVPGYDTIVALTGHLAARFAPGADCVYELGCSTGASLFSMRQHLAQTAHLIGVDASEAMIVQCRENLAMQSSGCTVTLVTDDITALEFDETAFVVLNFTLQFVPPEQRDSLLTRIARATRAGGALVLSEKIVFEDADQQALHDAMHLEFKRRNGYSQLEISQKRSALERVMVPETLATHRARLLAAGYRSCEVWFQCFNFVSLVAIK